MSSSYVRTTIKSFLAAQAPTEKFLDMTAIYSTLEDALAEATIDHDEAWVGLDFLPGDELPITIGSNNDHGKYRETGAVHIHVVDIAKLGVSGSILSRAETLRDLLRGQKIDRIEILSVTPTAFGPGAALQFEDGFMAGSFFVEYRSDTDF